MSNFHINTLVDESYYSVFEVVPDVKGAEIDAQELRSALAFYGHDYSNDSRRDVDIVSIEDDVKLSGDASCLFKGFNDIYGVEKLDTSNVNNMCKMFFGCSRLDYLDVSNFDISKVTNMSNMFADCENLTSLDVSGFDTSNVENMSGMFQGCSGLTSLDVSNWNTSNVTNMSCMFYTCSGLDDLDVSGFDTSNVINMAGMFYNCSNLNDLDLSTFNTNSLEDMSSMFGGCEKLQGLDLSNFDTSNVNDMHRLFVSCSGFKSLDLSSFDTSNVVDMGSMFLGCSSLDGLDVSNFDTSNVRDMRLMFADCSSLKTLDVSNFDTSKVTKMFGMFDECKSLEKLDVSGFVISNKVLADVDLFNRRDEFDTDNEKWKGRSFLLGSNNYLFGGCWSLKDIKATGMSMNNIIKLDFPVGTHLRGKILDDNDNVLSVNVKRIRHFSSGNDNWSVSWGNRKGYKSGTLRMSDNEVIERMKAGEERASFGSSNFPSLDDLKNRAKMGKVATSKVRDSSLVGNGQVLDDSSVPLKNPGDLGE